MELESRYTPSQLELAHTNPRIGILVKWRAEMNELGLLDITEETFRGLIESLCDVVNGSIRAVFGVP